MFQFQNGSIKSRMSMNVSAKINGFNSKMVRLKAGILFITIAGPASFNSKMVRLKELQITTADNPSRVSIPKWFD